MLMPPKIVNTPMRSAHHGASNFMVGAELVRPFTSIIAILQALS